MAYRKTFYGKRREEARKKRSGGPQLLEGGGRRKRPTHVPGRKSQQSDATTDGEGSEPDGGRGSGGDDSGSYSSGEAEDGVQEDGSTEGDSGEKRQRSNSGAHGDGDIGPSGTAYYGVSDVTPKWDHDPSIGVALVTDPDDVPLGDVKDGLSSTDVLHASEILLALSRGNG